MSLNIAAEGFSFNTAPVTDVSTVAAATFDGGQANIESAELTLSVDSTAAAAAVDLSALPSPSALGVVNGALVTVVKANAGGQPFTYTDPVTSITYNYVDRQGESISLQADNAGDQWVVRP